MVAARLPHPISEGIEIIAEISSQFFTRKSTHHNINLLKWQQVSKIFSDNDLMLMNLRIEYLKKKRLKHIQEC